MLRHARKIFVDVYYEKCGKLERQLSTLYFFYVKFVNIHLEGILITACVELKFYAKTPRNYLV